MKILAICPGCKKRKLAIWKRVYKTKHAGKITGQNETCGTCKHNVILLLGEEIVR